MKRETDRQVQKCVSNASDQFNTLEQYIVPSTMDREIVILTDAPMCGAVISGRSNTAALSAEATEILFASLATAQPLTIKEIINDNADRCGTACAWAKDSANEGIFQLTTTPPVKRILEVSKVESGQFIPVTDFNTFDRRGVSIEFPGTVTKVQVNNTTIFWYRADVALNEFPLVGYEAAVGSIGSLGISLLPKPIDAPLGINCKGCAVCSACAACAGCTLCGGLNLGAGLISIDGVLGVSGLAALAAPIILLRNNGLSQNSDEKDKI